MNDLFAIIYEVWFGLWESEYDVIFQTLFDYGGYNLLGLTFITVPLIIFASFYFLWKYPYANLWHWVLLLLVVFIVTGVISWGISNNEIFLSDNQSLIDALADPESGYEQFANTLPLKHALTNGFLSLILGFFYSLILKQFSKIQIHLPF